MRLAAAAGAVAFAAGVALAWQLQAGRWAAADLARAETDAESLRAARLSADAAAARHEATRARLAAQRVVITREVQRVVETPLYRDGGVCLDDAGLRVVAAAAGASAAGEPAPAMPGATPAD